MHPGKNAHPVGVEDIGQNELARDQFVGEIRLVHKQGGVTQPIGDGGANAGFNGFHLPESKRGRECGHHEATRIVIGFTPHGVIKPGRRHRCGKRRRGIAEERPRRKQIGQRLVHIVVFAHTPRIEGRINPCGAQLPVGPVQQELAHALLTLQHRVTALPFRACVGGKARRFGGHGSAVTFLVFPAGATGAGSVAIHTER